jgi:hypothetical protein
MKDFELLMERWKRLIEEEKEDDDCEDLEEWKAEDDADYKSRKKKKRNRAISHNASKHGDTFVPGHDELQQLAKGITEDIVNTDNVSVDIAALRSVVAISTILLRPLECGPWHRRQKRLINKVCPIYTTFLNCCIWPP